MRYAVKFGYDGTKFSGSQRQPKQSNVRTVEGEILDCLLEYQVVPNPKFARLQLASRTDAGVSALGNVLAVDTDFELEELLNIMNSNLSNCWFYAAAMVNSDFKPRYANGRWYRYHLFISDEPGRSGRASSKLTHPIDVETLSSITDMFCGEHDFCNFAKPQLEDTVRTIDSITLEPVDDWLLIDFKAQSFLWNQIRRLVSAWLKFVHDELSYDQLNNALTNPDHAHPQDFGMAPPEPLVLMDVQYDIKFKVDNKILKKTKTRIINQWQKVSLKRRLLEYLLEEL